MRVFLGGTCNGSKWRDRLIPDLQVDFFNPILASWTEEAYILELQERERCDILLYVITPLAEGYYSIAEVAEDSVKHPERTVLCILDEDDGRVWTPHQRKSLTKVGRLVSENGGQYCEGFDALHDMLAARMAGRSRGVSGS